MNQEQKEALNRVIEAHDDEVDHHGATYTSSEDIDLLRPLVTDGLEHRNVFDKG